MLMHFNLGESPSTEFLVSNTFCLNSLCALMYILLSAHGHVITQQTALCLSLPRLFMAAQFPHLIPFATGEPRSILPF